jgi:PAS domain S-box-containing protein
MFKLNRTYIDIILDRKLITTCFFFGLGYFLMGCSSHFLSIKPNYFIPLWLPAGLYTATLFFTEYKKWPYFIMAAILSNVFYDLTDHKPLWLTLIFSTANSFDAMIGVWLFRKINSFRPTFGKPIEIITFFIINASLSPCVSATISSGTLALVNGLPFWYTWFTWWSGATVGIILIAPIVLIIGDMTTNGIKIYPFRRMLEFAAMLFSVVILSWLIFSGTGQWLFSQKHIILYVMIWAIFRFGNMGVIWANLLMAFTFIYCHTQYSTDTIWHLKLTIEQESIAIQIYVSTICFMSLFVSAVISDRNRSIKELRYSERKFKSLFDHARDAIFIHDENGYFLEVNETICQRLGYRKDELLTKKIFDIVSSKYVSKTGKRIHTILHDGQMFFETEHVTKEGRVISTEVNASAIYYGKVLAVLSTARDITERKLAENKLKDNEERYRLVIKASNDGIWDWDLRTDDVYYSSRWKEMLGYADNESGNNAEAGLSKIHPDDLPKVKQLIKDHLEKNKPFQHTSRFFHKDGSARWIQVNGFALRDCDGQPYRLIGNHTDITDKKLVEDKLRESELRFRIAFMTSPDSITLSRFDDGVYIDVNEGFTRFSGWTREDAIGHSSRSLNYWVYPEQREKLIEQLSLHGFCHNLEAQLKIKQGNSHTCLMSASIIELEQQKCILIISRDITDRKIIENQILEKNAKIETQNKELIASFHKIRIINDELIESKEKAEEADRLKSAFLANMSHEIRTPLNAILGFADLLTFQNASLEKQQKYSKIIKQRGMDLLSLVNDLLDISKIEAGQMVISEHSGTLKELFEEIYQSFLPKANAEKDVRFKYTLKNVKDDALIDADFTHIKQILFNLIGNSFKFTRSGLIEFGCSLINDQLCFYVSDTGIGIPKDKQEVIFERFRQASDSYLSNEFGGTGLGLSIARALVELQKGKVWVESEVNKGTVFYFTIPFKSTNQNN